MTNLDIMGDIKYKKYVFIRGLHWISNYTKSCKRPLTDSRCRDSVSRDIHRQRGANTGHDHRAGI
jgi:hypothetical protein